MFCQKCGSWIRKDFKFCPKCGSNAVPSGTVSNLKDWKARKSEERQSLVKGSKKFKKTGNGNMADESVTITIGLACSDRGVWKVIRGRSLPLKVKKSASSETLLSEAVKKRITYDCSFRANRLYKLCYPDGTEVVQLPGSEEAFTLEKYKEDLGRTYARITLYLCQREDEEEENEEEDQEMDSVDIDQNVSDIDSLELDLLESPFESQTLTFDDFQVDLPEDASSTCVEAPNTNVTPNQFDASFPCTTTTHNDGSNEIPSQFDSPIPSITAVETGIGKGPCKPITLRRALLKKDLLEVFEDPAVLHCNLDITIKGYNGQEEAGKGIGVLKEALTSFWNDCYNSMSIGATEKVLCVRHDYQKLQWEALGRIVVYGFVVANYFPLALSRSFVSTVLFGEESLSPEYLFDSFKLFISEEDRAVVEEACGDNFDPKDEDLLDFLTSLKCYKLPTKQNIKALVNELAHQEIVQKPRYIVDCISPIVTVLRTFTAFQTVSDLDEFYSAKTPTAKKVVKLLSGNPKTDAEQNSFGYLKQFVKCLQSTELSKFLQFVSGSNIITCEIIDVSFTNLDGNLRRPIVHTCGPSLELPSTYQCYNELTEEFTALLNDKESWSFNIV